MISLAILRESSCSNIEKEQAECVGIIDTGLKAMSWSPDYEIVAFATGKGTLMFMTKEWEVRHSIPFYFYFIFDFHTISFWIVI